MSVVRGRPPGLAAGIRGASTAYCSSLSACPAPKSPTKTRLSAVHMTCLQEGLLPSLNGWHDHSISSSVSTARASQTGSKKPRMFPFPRIPSASPARNTLTGRRGRKFKVWCASEPMVEKHQFYYRKRCRTEATLLRGFNPHSPDEITILNALDAVLYKIQYLRRS